MGLPLYLAAVSLNAGPSFFAVTEWHFMQLLFFASACAASASTAWTGNTADRARTAAATDGTKGIEMGFMAVSG